MPQVPFWGQAPVPGSAHPKVSWPSLVRETVKEFAAGVGVDGDRVTALLGVDAHVGALQRLSIPTSFSGVAPS